MMKPTSLHFRVTLTAFSTLENRWVETPKLRPLLAVAALVAVVALPILLLLDLTRYCLNPAPLGDHHHFYSSEIFAAYQKELQGYVAKEVEAHPELAQLELVQWVQSPVQDRAAFYRGFIKRLRQAVSHESQNREFIERLCNWVYTGPHLLPAMNQWMKGEFPNQDFTKTSAKELQALHQQLSIDPKFRGESFADYRPYDPAYLGDAPTHLYQVGNTQIIRTPAVTREGERSLFGRLVKATVVEEFQGYLSHCEREKKTHLYINLMARKESEKVRTEALESLEKEHSSALQLVTLSKDCLFYHQRGYFAELNEASAFKSHFIHQMLSGKNPAYHWPIGWNKAEIYELCEQAIHRVHRNYFGLVIKLNREERRKFIELAYTEIIQSLIQKYQPTTCNISCRSCVDRGAVNLALLYAQTQPSQEALATIALAPALLAQNRPPMGHRVERLIPALAHIQGAK